jgi:hypothetical protein
MPRLFRDALVQRNERVMRSVRSRAWACFQVQIDLENVTGPGGETAYERRNQLRRQIGTGAQS